jgi:hypothetical protein
MFVPENLKGLPFSRSLSPDLVTKRDPAVFVLVAGPKCSMSATAAATHTQMSTQMSTYLSDPLGSLHVIR